MAKYLVLALFFFVLTGCSSPPSPCSPSAGGDVIYVVEQGWHVEIGVPVNELDSNLQFLNNVFSGARVIMFGYGKKTFMTAPPQTWSEYILGPIPGPAVIHAVGLSVTPVEAYPVDSTIVLALPPGGWHGLSDYLANDLIKNTAGKAMIITRSTDPDGLYYAAASEYNLFHTCNTWAADALHAAGLSISTDNVVFSGQVMTQVYAAAHDQCQPLI